ncbi:hypothetical protein DDB_G0289235 [Dictyostelium discoideum AX4]|uniref:U3 small nucleolar RNA-associated protein 25 n=1 Tax=Dictyostelium discoideum TaxID=44689 RepID=Q54HT2_DICDI|nr:hypothetical protein DDB_G0289235 [Dictyostelium discoideum AX4]EAL62851.1 hypothetical protein DDB_G0289235 [Dictyostelium discoideum AX4]|eukprot:XP_636357.1 hypothetical protein DDB_G0289235 [Dictyostelium discoideum AX4]
MVGKKQKLSKKIAKKYTLHRKYYSDTVSEFSSLNPFQRTKKSDKYAAISQKVNAQNQRIKELEEQQEQDELEQEIGGDVDTLYEVGPSSYDLLVKSSQDKLKLRLKQLEEQEKLEKKLEKNNKKRSFSDIKDQNQDEDEDEDEDNDIEEDVEDDVKEDVEEDAEEDVEEEEEEEEVEGEEEEEEVEGEEEDEEEEVEEEDEEEEVEGEEIEEVENDLNSDIEENEEQDFTDVYGNKDDKEEEEEVETNKTLEKLKKSELFENTNDNGIYNIHFNKDITSKEEMNELLLKSQSLESISKEIEDIGVITSIGCVDYDNLINENKPGKSNQKKVKEQKESILPNLKNTFHDYDIKKRLYKPWLKSKTKKENELYFTNLQKNLFPIFNEYRDLLYTEESMKNHKSIFKLYALHAVNHIFKSKDQLSEDNALINECKKLKKPEPDLRHQGFTRPKVVIIVPFRNTAFEIVRFILKLVPHELKDQVENKTKFNNEYTQFDQDQEINENKPDDYKYIFRDNIDDCFRFGLSFRKGGVKLYSTFYHADIIIASPLGLRLVIGTEGDSQRDFDFLSSVEVLIIDQIDSIQQQNWDHINVLFENLNRIPTQDHNIDFSRLRNSSLEGLSSNLRQTLLFSSNLTPELNSIFNQHCKNISGKIRIKKIKNGEITNIVPSLRQTFHRLYLDSNDDSKIRFNFLIDNILPKFVQQGENSGILLYISNFFEFTMIRNYFRKEAKSYVICSEYTDPKAVTRARSQFKESAKTIMLFTERFHFFNRYHIRGIKHVIFFGLPQNSHFYSEILNMITENDGSIISLYTLKDKMALERIVGTQRSYKMLESDKPTHLFSN